MRPTSMGLLAKKTLRYVLASVRPVKGSQPVALRQSGLDSRCHIPTWGSSCLRADESSLHVRPSTPESYTLYYPAQSGLRHKYTILKLNDK